MKLQKKLFCLFVVAVLLFTGMPVQAVELGSTSANDTAVLQNRVIHGCDDDFYIKNTSEDHSFMCESNVIPVDFSIFGLRPGENCTLKIESTLAITHNLDTNATYSAENNHVSFQMQIQEKPTVQSLDSVYLMDYKYITITITTDGKPVQTATVDFYIINSQNGLFASIVGEEAVFRCMTTTLYENNQINENTYDAAIATTYCEPKSLEEQMAVNSFKSASRSSGLVSTSLTVLYTITVLSSGQLRVDGNVSWTDMNLVSHAARGIKVMIMDKDVLSSEILVELKTDDSGNFSCIFSNQTDEGGCDIFLKVLAITNNYIDVITDGGGYCQVDTSNVVGIHNDVVSTLPTQTATFSGDGDMLNGFQVHQAAYAAMYYACNILSRDIPYVKIVYPVSGTCGYDSASNTIQITTESFSSWDVIMHEYGHHVAHAEAIDDSPGGAHDRQFDMIMQLGKLNGCRIAWSEGWATYFGLSAQTVSGTYNLGIPSVGDAEYTSYPNDIEYSIEAESGLGEGNELAVAAVLWDMADSPNSPGSKYESFENINLGFDAVARHVLNSNKTTFADFLNTMYTNGVLNTTSTNVYNIGALLGKQKIAASNLSYDDSWDFGFTVAQGSTLNPMSYYVEIYDSTITSQAYWASIGTYSNSEHVVYYSLPSEIVSSLADGEDYYWRITLITAAEPTSIYRSEFQLVNFVTR